MKERLQRTCYLIDVEGVLVRDKRYQPIEGSVAWFNGLAQRGIRACLVSNNTTHRPEEQVAVLTAAGFDVRPEQLVSALNLGQDLLARCGKRRVLWLGHPRLVSYWQERGFTLVKSGACDAVVLGVNPELSIADLERALPALLDHGADLVALHRNIFWLDEQGERRLGPGAWSAALEGLTRLEGAVCMGKPSERIYREALERIGATAAEALFIADDPVADLVTAKRMGMVTAFVLSGKYADHGILAQLDQEDWPDLIAERPAVLDEEESD
jgi:HAD superfamily hydrolase (TIGR01450 family)